MTDQMSSSCFTLIERHQRFLLCFLSLLSSLICLGFGFRCLHKKRRHIHDNVCLGVANDASAIVLVIFGVLLLVLVCFLHRYFSRRKVLEVDSMNDETGPFNISQTDEYMEDGFWFCVHDIHSRIANFS